jgi:hypothetical protein
LFGEETAADVGGGEEVWASGEGCGEVGGISGDGVGNILNEARIDGAIFEEADEIGVELGATGLVGRVRAVAAVVGCFVSV